VTNYDAITEQFGPALSDLARRMYAGLFDVVTNPLGRPSVDEWPTDSAGEAALRELILCGLVEPVRGGSTVSYRLTSAAWRAHLLAEQTIRDIAREIVEAWDAATGPTEAAWKIAVVLPRLRAALSDKSTEDRR
jgi:hypothetical protein